MSDLRDEAMDALVYLSDRYGHTVEDDGEDNWARFMAIQAALGPGWECDWEPDELNPREDGCPYCAGRMCARFDGLGCTHNRRERHGYQLATGGGQEGAGR
jgi:hypothetical protein